MELPCEAIDFLESLSIERGCSNHTISSYTFSLQHYFDWLKSNNYTIDNVNIREYIAHLKTTLKNVSVKQRLACLKSFYNYISATYVCDIKPAFPKRIKSDKYFVSTISSAQVQLLLNSVSTRKNQLSEQSSSNSNNKRLQKQINNCTRDLAIITLLVGTGIRVGELMGINISDINTYDKCITIRGKGNKIRQVFFDVPVIENALSEYLKLRLSLDAHDDALFLNSKSLRRITTRSIERMLKIYLNIAGLPKSVSPHILRHTYATISIENGANIKAISKLLGHANVKTTLEYYTHLSNEYLHKVFIACHPCIPSTVSIKTAMENRSAIITDL